METISEFKITIICGYFARYMCVPFKLRFEESSKFVLILKAGNKMDSVPFYCGELFTKPQ